MADSMFQPTRIPGKPKSVRIVYTESEHPSKAKGNRERIRESQEVWEGIPYQIERPPEFDAALEVHYREQLPKFKRYLTSKMNGEFNAVDAIQAAYVKAMECWRSFDPTKGEFGAWFRPILTQKRGEQGRDEHNRGMTNRRDDDDVTIVHLATYNIPRETELLKLMEIKGAFRLANSRPEPVRSVLKAVLFDQFSIEEVAAGFHRPVNTVKSDIRRFREELCG